MKASGQGVDDILYRSSSGYYQIPNFQREFIWSIKDINKLAESALLGMPCGAIVTWENPTTFPANGFHSVRIPVTSAGKEFIDFPAKEIDLYPIPNIVIDGLQRITALSVAFGGLRNKKGNQKFPGRFYVNIDNPTISGSVTYKSVKQMEKENLDEEDTWLATGLFPLYSNENHKTETLVSSQASHWQKIQGLVSGNAARVKRIVLINKNLSADIIADMQIAGSHELSEIADTFEMLNTQGTTVSMVDILHATLYAWYDAVHGQEFQLRDWIDGINQDAQYSHGWGNKVKRQLILQFGVAIELLSSKRLPPRTPQSKKPDNIDTKSILNMSEQLWCKLEQNEGLFKECIKNFQMCVLGNQFPQADCPYAISASIYIALYWKSQKENVSWTHKRLDQVFRAFFWTNSLSLNYETDSLGVKKDTEAIEVLLNENCNASDPQWKKIADQWLTDWLSTRNPLPTPTQIQKLLKEKNFGAMQDALQLPIKYLASVDLLDPKSSTIYPAAVQVHHIFPKKWINANGTSANLGKYYNASDLDEFINSIANKTSLIPASNNLWSADSPGAVISGTLINTNQQKGNKVWTERFIKDGTFDALKANAPQQFIELRAVEIEEWLTSQCEIQL